MQAADLLSAARAGDGEAFRALVAPHLRSLHVHCYRMLGSYDDAEEALQEALLRAWRSLATYEGRGPLRHWLYRITTTTCLKAIERRGRGPVVAGEITHLQPYPDRLLDQLGAEDPAAAVERRESVALAFVSALQRLPATQRAVLILRDVLCWSGGEVAELMATSVAAVNSMLQRARATVGRAGEAARPLDARDLEVLDRFVLTWNRRDIAGLAALLHEDAVLRMPPEDAVFLGRAAVTEFFATVPAEGRLETIRLVPTAANGQAALAAYVPDDTGRRRAYGIIVFEVGDGVLTSITGFPGTGSFEAFGLPAEETDLPGGPAGGAEGQAVLPR